MFPRWFVILANIIITAALVALGLIFKWAGWQFALGVGVGVFIAHLQFRLDHGKWF